MDEALVGEIAGGERLRGVALSALSTIVVGAGAYGFAFGIWRAPEQAIFAAIKLPAVVISVVLVTTLINTMLAWLLRAKLGLRQSAVCILVGMASTSAILGALSPIAIFVALNVTSPDPSLVGMPLTAPRADAANRAAQSLLLFHVGAIAIAGVFGNLRLFALLSRLGGRRDIALRVLAVWLGIELLAGSEISWLYRPFLARPHRALEFMSSEMFEGSFFEEVADACVHALGTFGFVISAVWMLGLVITAWLFLRQDGITVDIEPGARGIAVVADEARFFVPWPRVSGVTSRQSTLLLESAHELVLDVVGAPSKRLLVRPASREARDALASRVEALRSRVPGDGPFRHPATTTPTPRA